MAKPNPLSQGLSKQVRPAATPAGDEATRPAAAQVPAAAVRAVPPSRTGRKLIGGHFAPEVQTELKVLAAREGTTVQELVAEGLNAVFARRQLPQIATLSPQLSGESGQEE